MWGRRGRTAETSSLQECVSVAARPGGEGAARFLQDEVREGREAREAGVVRQGWYCKTQYPSHFAVVFF